VTTALAPLAKTSADPVVRVVKGKLGDEELAALTAVLLARAAADQGRDAKLGAARGQARWQRLERRPGYRSPVSWTS
jgi:hypothetical protein